MYEGQIPGYRVNTVVSYRIIAYDKAGNEAVRDRAGSYYVYVAIPEFHSFITMPISMLVVLITVLIARKRYMKHTSSLQSC